MSYLANRLRGLPVALLIVAVYFALPSAFRKHWGDAAFTVLMCLGLTFSASPETYFRRRIPALEKRKKRNLVANWTGLLVSTAVAAVFAQHESMTGRMILWRPGQYLPRGFVLGPLVFFITYFVLWLVFRPRLDPDVFLD
jgi:hypothetical protein